MKRFFRAALLAVFMGIPLAALSHGVSETQIGTKIQSELSLETAPVCDSSNIAAQELAIKSDEYKKSLMRAGVYVCLFAGASYLGYKFFTPSVVVNTDPSSFTDEEKTVLKLVAKNAQSSSFLSGRWFKNLFIGARDMAFQSAVLGGFYGVGSYFQKQLFYGKKVGDFYLRATNLVTIQGDLEGCATMLEAPEYRDSYRSGLQSLIKVRTLELCSSVERVISYMHVVCENEKNLSKNTFVVIEKFLIDRTNNALALLWQSATDNEKKSADLARSIALTLHIFSQDFTQAVERFDTAFYLATNAS